jgi:hypothetical protein
MKLLTIRFIGYGVTGFPLEISEGSFVAGTSRKQFQFKIPAPAAGEELSPWSFVHINDYTTNVIPSGRYGVVSVTSVDAGANRLVRCVSDVAIPGAATSFAGTLYLDENYTFADRIPAEVTQRSRWSDSAAVTGLSFGGKFSPLGGLQSTPGTGISLVRGTLANAIMGHAPRPVFSTATGDVVRIVQLMGQADDPVISEVFATPAHRTVTIDRECISLVYDVEDTNPVVRRGALGTLARAHIQNSPLYLGCPSAVGREIEIWVYNDPAHCLDTEYRYRGIVDVEPQFAEGMTRIEMSVRSGALIPRSIVPSTDVLSLVNKPVPSWLMLQEQADGLPVYNYIEVAQADPGSTWSWCRFGSVLVRVKKTDVYTPTELGYVLVRYKLPAAFHRLAFTTVDPKISKRDAVNLTGFADPAATNLRTLIEVYGFSREAGEAILSLEAERREIVENDENWIDENGRIQFTLYVSAKPEMCHLFETEAARTVGVNLEIWDTDSLGDAQTYNPEGFYVPTCSSLEIVSQIVKSVDGTGGGFNLLPSEFSVASPLEVITLQAQGFPTLSGVVISAANSSDLGKWLSDSVLKPTFTSVAIGADGTWRVFCPLGFIGGRSAKTSAAITIDTLIGDAGAIAPVYTSDHSIRDISVEISAVAQAYRTTPDQRLTVRRDSVGSGYYSAGDIYAGAITGSIKFSYIEDPITSLGPFIYNDMILAMFGRPLYSITVSVHRSYLGDVGDYVPITLPEIPDIYGNPGFDGYGFIVEKSINRQTDESSITICLFPDPAQGVRVWTPFFVIDGINSNTSIEVDGSLCRGDATVASGPLLPGQSVVLLDQYGTRRDDTGATVSAYSESGAFLATITLAAAFKSGGVDVTPAAGDIIIHNERTDQSGAVTLQFGWFDSSLSPPSRWL